jgi:hypothetical protein
LDNFDQIDIVHHSNGDAGWEPFDRHSCGPMPLEAYRRCLELIYGDTRDYLAPLNEIYTKTAQGPIVPFDKGKSIGFKIRLRSKQHHPFVLLRKWRDYRFRQVSYELFQNYGVVVFILIRQDVFRWAVSEYHGDGKGGSGHLQFKLAAKEITRDQIPKLTVNLDAFEKIIRRQEAMIAGKKRLHQALTSRGIAAYPLLYEQFCDDKSTYFRNLLSKLEIRYSDEEIDGALAKGSYYQKVHSTNVGEFFLNADQLIERFGNRFVSWA